MSAYCARPRANELRQVVWVRRRRLAQHEAPFGLELGPDSRPVPVPEILPSEVDAFPLPSRARVFVDSHCGRKDRFDG